MTADKQKLEKIAGQVWTWFGGRTFVWIAVAVALAYLIIAIVMTWPLATQLATHTPAGHGGDVWAHQWTYWWIKTAISQGQNPFFTDLLYYPIGVSLATHNIAWFNIGLWWPLQAVIGSQAAYGLIYILAFAFNGLAMFLLIREYTDRTAAAFIGGLIYGTWPYVMSQTGHPNTIIIGWVPLALLMLKRTMERGRLRDAVAAGVFLALIGIVRWQLLIMASIAIGLFIIHKLATDAACRSRRTVIHLLFAGLVSLVLMAPLLAPVIADTISRESLDPFLITQPGASSDLLAFIVPNHRLWLFGDLARQLPVGLHFSSDAIEFIGFTALILLVVGVIRGRRSAWLWILMLLIYSTLALGPELKIGHQPLPGVPMPYRFIQDFFLVRVLRFPARFNVFLGLPVAMLAGIGLSFLLGHPRLGRRPVFLVTLLAIMICAEYWLIPYRTLPLHTPEWYDQLAQEPGEFAVLDLPMDRQGVDKNYMFYQINHGRPILQGHVSRLPPEASGFLNSNPFLKRLAKDNTMESTMPVMYQLGQLSDAGIRYLILHRQRATADQLAQWLDWLAFEPLYEDDELIVYGTDPTLVRDLPEGSMVTEALSIFQADFEPKEVTPTDPIYISTRWGSTQEPDLDYDLCFQLLDEAGQIAQEQCQTLGGEWPTSQWIASELAFGNMVMRIDPFLEPGAFQLTAVLAEADTGSVAGEQIHIGQLTINSTSRVYELPDNLRSTDAIWEDVISLPGYVIERSEEQLELTLYWQALDRIDSSYKVFVHLIDETTGAVVVQDDAVPRQWSYPTNWWERGEVVEDTIMLPVKDLAPGNYLLFIGWYDPESGARLEITTASGDPYPDNSVFLTAWQR